MKLPEAARERCESLVIEKTVRLFSLRCFKPTRQPGRIHRPRACKKKKNTAGWHEPQRRSQKTQHGQAMTGDINAPHLEVSVDVFDIRSWHT